MNVIHKNSREEFDLSYPNYYKYYSIYGYLVMTIARKIFFIDDLDSVYGYTDITDDFEITEL